MAIAIKENTSASQLILSLCDFNDKTFEILVNAICERKNNFIFVDISSNQYLTMENFRKILKLIDSNKVEELNIGRIGQITLRLFKNPNPLLQMKKKKKRDLMIRGML
jgi:hypothetical protein